MLRCARTGVAVLLVCVCVAAAYTAHDEACGATCIASFKPKDMRVRGSLDVGKNSLNARGLHTTGGKGTGKALASASLTGARKLRTRMLDVDRVTTKELEVELMRSPTGAVTLAGRTSVTGSIRYTAMPSAATASFLQLEQPEEGSPDLRPWMPVVVADGNKTSSLHWSSPRGVRLLDCASSSSAVASHCDDGGDVLRLLMPSLPPHSKLLVVVNLHMAGDWHGAVAAVAVDEQPVWVETAPEAAQPLPFCSFDSSSRIGVRVRAEVPHSAPSATLHLRTTLPRSSCNTAALLVDSVEVHLR